MKAEWNFDDGSSIGVEQVSGTEKVSLWVKPPKFGTTFEIKIEAVHAAAIGLMMIEAGIGLE